MRAAVRNVATRFPTAIVPGRCLEQVLRARIHAFKHHHVDQNQNSLLCTHFITHAPSIDDARGGAGWLA
jgi:hypothetical protein